MDKGILFSKDKTVEVKHITLESNTIFWIALMYFTYETLISIGELIRWIRNS